MPKTPMGAQIPGLNLKDAQPGGIAGATLNYLNQPTNAPSMPATPQPQWGNTPTMGTQVAANPNNNYMVQALGGQSPGYQPNSPNPIGVPIANSPSVNSQTSTSAFGNMPQTNQGVPLGRIGTYMNG